MIVFESFFFFFLTNGYLSFSTSYRFGNKIFFNLTLKSFSKWISTLRQLFSLYLFVKAFSKTIVKSFTFKIKFNFS